MTRRERFFSVIGLTLLAALLAFLQWKIGVRTDEAKYLLDIPYPHPPLIRTVLSWTETLPFQELLWRFLFALLLVHGVWLAISLVPSLSPSRRLALAVAWLGSSALLLQAGTVMMAPLTALQGLVLLWLYVRDRDGTHHVWLLGLFWLAMLFTAYQGILFAPLAFALFLRMRLPLRTRLLLFAVPVLLLALYTLSNPLAAASMTIHAGKDAAQTFPERVRDTLGVWGWGGSFVVSVLGTIGLFLRPRWPVFLSFLLVFAYVFLSRYEYYAILFLPFFLIGTALLLPRPQFFAWSLAGLTPLATVLLIWMRPPVLAGSIAARLLPVIASRGITGDILIEGPFGHEWQYASRFPVRRFREDRLDKAQTVVCLRPCPVLQTHPLWERVRGEAVDVWVKKP